MGDDRLGGPVEGGLGCFVDLGGSRGEDDRLLGDEGGQLFAQRGFVTAQVQAGS